MRDLTCPLVAAAWLVSLATAAVTEPFCKRPNESEARQETIPVLQWESGQFEVEVTVPQVNIRATHSWTLYTVIYNYI